MFESIKSWLRKHRKAVLVTATVLAITGTVAVLLIKGKKVEIPVEQLAEKIVPDVPKLDENTMETISVIVDGEVKTFPRKSFIRQLHEGWKASPAKLAQAEELNIDLKPGETIVDKYMVTLRIAA